jgi:hypothetical protein
MVGHQSFTSPLESIFTTRFYVLGLDQTFYAIWQPGLAMPGSPARESKHLSVKCSPQLYLLLNKNRIFCPEADPSLRNILGLFLTLLFVLFDSVLWKLNIRLRGTLAFTYANDKQYGTIFIITRRPMDRTLQVLFKRTLCTQFLPVVVI